MTHRLPWLIPGLLAMALLGALPAAATPASQTSEAAPATIACKEKTKAVLHTKDAQRIDATLVAFDARGVDYLEKTTADGEAKGRVTWALMSARDANTALKAAVDAKDVGQLLLASRIVQALPDGGEREAAKWRDQALKLAPDAKARVEEAKKAPPPFPPALVPGRRMQAPAGANPAAWPAETANSMRAALAEATGQTNRALGALKLRMEFHQNDLFALYSDLPPEETRKWAARFGNIYAGMAQAFGMNPKTNIWHGKAVILLFKSQEEYLKYHRLLSPNDNAFANSAGLCRSYSDGRVEISMWQDPENPNLEYVLYHEFSHGFLHRYQASTHVPSWANEGLAEFMASRFIRANHSETDRAAGCIAALKAAGSFEDFFAAQHIQGKHYGVAGDITRMLVECDPKRYGLFLNWLKRGEKPDAALQKSYGLTLEELTKAYGARIGAAKLRSH